MTDAARPPRDGSGRGQEAAEALSRVDRALEDGDLDAALDAALDAQRRLPDEAEVHAAAGHVLRLADRPTEALAAFERARALDPELPDPWLDAAEILLEETGDGLAALDLLRLAEPHVTEPDVRADLLVLRGAALARMGDLTGSLRLFDEALAVAPDHPAALVERAWTRVELLRLDDAEGDLRRALTAGADDPRAHQHLAFLLDYTGRREEAERHFAAAAEIDPDLPARPPRLDEKAFDRAVADALAAVPAAFRERLANIEIAVENYASRDFCRVHDCGPGVLGLYVGTPETEKEGVAAPAALPGRILLFQRAIENGCADRRELVEEIGVTLRHEIGHHLGFSEEDLEGCDHA